MKPLALAMLYYAVQSEESKSGLSTTYWVWQEQQQQKLLLTKAILLTRLLLRDPIIKHEKNCLGKKSKSSEDGQAPSGQSSGCFSLWALLLDVRVQYLLWQLAPHVCAPGYRNHQDLGKRKSVARNGKRPAGEIQRLFWV